MQTDVAVRDHGTIVQFQPLTPKAKTWFADNVEAEPWQWRGRTLCVDHRPAQWLLDGLFATDLVVSAA